MNITPDLLVNKFDMKGRVVLVTGGAGILGSVFCESLAQSGASVIVADINEKLVVDCADFLIDRYGCNALPIKCDVSNPASVDAMVAAAVEKFGEIHVLLNNAAGKSANLEEFFKPFEEYSLEQWRNIMSVNIDGMFLVAKAVGKQMIKQQKGGSIIQTASIYGVVAPDQRIYEGSYYLDMEINTPAVYSTSKAAVIGLSKYLAAYWAKHGIRVNTLTPGGVESGQNEVFKKNYSARVPLGRMANSNEMAGAILFLASDASSYVTGQNIIVDGGLSCW